MRLPRFDIETARKEAVVLKETFDEHENGKKFLDEILDKKVTLDSAGEVESSDAIFEKAYAFMVELAEKGMQKLGWHKSPEHINALKLELSDVRVAWESNRMDFATYFLIVWDYINFARSKKILTGCGRGSGYASLLLRTLGITYGPDPLEYGLIWERFLGFDEKFYLNDHDWGFGEAEETTEIETDDEETEDLYAERAVEDDQGGQDRY
jgi:DNA polymerase III alpha subunit